MGNIKTVQSAKKKKQKMGIPKCSILAAALCCGVAHAGAVRTGSHDHELRLELAKGQPSRRRLEATPAAAPTDPTTLQTGEPERRRLFEPVTGATGLWVFGGAVAGLCKWDWGSGSDH